LPRQQPRQPTVAAVTDDGFQATHLQPMPPGESPHTLRHRLEGPSGKGRAVHAQLDQPDRGPLDAEQVGGVAIYAEKDFGEGDGTLTDGPLAEQRGGGTVAEECGRLARRAGTNLQEV